MRYLKNCLLKERQENAVQVLFSYKSMVTNIYIYIYSELNMKISCLYMLDRFIMLNTV